MTDVEALFTPWLINNFVKKSLMGQEVMSGVGLVFSKCSSRGPGHVEKHAAGGVGGAESGTWKKSLH